MTEKHRKILHQQLVDALDGMDIESLKETLVRNNEVVIDYIKGEEKALKPIEIMVKLYDSCLAEIAANDKQETPCDDEVMSDEYYEDLVDALMDMDAESLSEIIADLTGIVMEYVNSGELSYHTKELAKGMLATITGIKNDYGAMDKDAEYDGPIYAEDEVMDTNDDADDKIAYLSSADHDKIIENLTKELEILELKARIKQVKEELERQPAPFYIPYLTRYEPCPHTPIEQPWIVTNTTPPAPVVY